MLQRLQSVISKRIAAVVLMATVAVAYFLAARLGLSLVTQPEDVAVFWPASGLAAGLLIVLEPRLRNPVLAGVILATIVANLMGDRNVLSSIAFALCNAGEAYLAAKLVERWSGRPFALDSLHRVLALLLAGGAAAATAAAAAAIAMWLFQSHAPVFNIWRVWAISDGLGIVAVSPLLIGIASAIRNPPRRRELLEGLVALLALAGMTAFIFTLPSESWMAFEPIAVLFPVLLWIAARCPPVFAGAAVFVITVGLVWTATFGIGSYGNPATPLVERVFAAQLAMLLTVLCAFVPAALFAERRKSEAALDKTNKRLQLALDGAELGVWDVEAATGRFTCDERDCRIHGCDLIPSPTWQAAMLSCVHPDDLPGLYAAVSAALKSSKVFKAEYRVVEGRTDARPRRIRWVAAEGSVIRDRHGHPTHVHGVSRDITASKESEAALKESEARLQDALRAGQVMAFEWDPTTGVSRRSENSTQILGSDPNGKADALRDFLSHVHPDDRKEFISQVCRVTPDSPSYAVSFRFIRSNGREVWLEETAKAEFDSSGRFVLLRGLTRDVTARNAAQKALEESERQFRLLVQGVRDYAVVMLDPNGNVINWNPGAERILGYRADEIVGQNLRRFHPPEDGDTRSADNALAVSARDGRYEVEGWRVRQDGSRFWANVVIDAIRGEDGALVGFAKVTRDISERKRFEEHQALLIAELDHRVKNSLARVAIVAQRTRETSPSMSEFVTSLHGRIQSMANAHALLSQSRWQGVELADLVRSELAPYTSAHNTFVDGPDIRLTANATQAVAMVLHELVTNAAKYGALSGDLGRVVVTWRRVEDADSQAQLLIEWLETVGSPVAPAPPTGYGTSVIRNLIPHQLGGSVEYALEPSGVRCRMEVPWGCVATARPDTALDGVYKGLSPSREDGFRAVKHPRS